MQQPIVICNPEIYEIIDNYDWPVTITNLLKSGYLVKIDIYVADSFNNHFLQLVHSWYSWEDWMIKEQTELNNEIPCYVWRKATR